MDRKKGGTGRRRELRDLYSVGPRTVEDLKALGIYTVEQLKSQKAGELYGRLCALKGKMVDPCCKDVFRSAIEQAKNPELPEEKKPWWYWTRVRKGTIRED